MSGRSSCRPALPRAGSHPACCVTPSPSLRLDDKIRKLDEQLLKHKDTIQKTRGPAQDAAKRRALVVRDPCRCCLDTQLGSPKARPLAGETHSCCLRRRLPCT